jgi:hypothetical protein
MLEEAVGGHQFWYKDLWTWNIPLKIKPLCWLMLEQNILGKF